MVELSFINVVAVIPAYHPSEAVRQLVAELAAGGILGIIVVDDGSGAPFDDIFESCRLVPRVHLLRHAVNLGKGAALKTGFNYALCTFPTSDGVVTADADGQHLAEDVLKVARRLAKQPDSLVLGTRDFGAQVPLRSRIGNSLTRHVVHLLVGRKIFDTQTGLRGVPRCLLPQLLKVASSGYEFELDMLIASKHQGCAVVEERVRTIYEDRNRSSHFNPLRDSMRIYFVLARFSLLSFLTACVDNLVFFRFFAWSGSIIQAQAVGRAVAVLFNYGAARKAVFLSHERHRAVLPKYLLLVLVSGLVSYSLIELLRSTLPVGVFWAKIGAESLLFVANFVIQRDLVFTRRQATGGATDWDRYYTSVPITARVTRKYTAAELVSALKRHAGFQNPEEKTLVELGGANSCFLERILSDVRPRAYHIVDSNHFGLELLRQRLGNASEVLLHEQNVLDLSLDVKADAVFSVGLIEHFDGAGTRKAIQAHFDVLRPGGYAILSFPTPTLLYRAARALTVQFGMWRFPDERPLKRNEVLESTQGIGRVVHEKTLWPLVFTQHFMVFQKLETAATALQQ